MLRYFINWINSMTDIPGGNLINYISVQALLAFTISMLFSLIIGKKTITFLTKRRMMDEERKLGLEGEDKKKDTPNMGGVIIILCMLFTILLLADITNFAVRLLVLSIIWFGVIGFVDDYIKVFKKDKKGLAGKYKLVGQLGFALILAASMLYNPSLEVEREFTNIPPLDKVPENLIEHTVQGKTVQYVKVHSNITTIPFVKEHVFNYEKLLPNFLKDFNLIVYFIIISFIIIATSNAANLTDGMDGLLSGISAIIGVGLAIFAYVSGNLNLAHYLDLLYVPYANEIVIVCIALVGACVGFLWFNIFPAQVFMGDTGSLCLGGLIATITVLIRKELVIPILCGVFFIEALSVSLQVSYFKYTKKKYGKGKRIFLMSPIHHHFKLKGLHENKIVVRFWIISVLLMICSILTLKIR